MSKSKISDFKPQRRNANKHTQRGGGMLDNSIRKDGYSGEAMVAASDGELFIGSRRLEVSADVLGVDVEPIVVHSDGSRPVIVIRDDIPDANDPRAIRLGLGSNRIAEVSYEIDIDVLQGLSDFDGVDLGDWWNEKELTDLGVELDGEVPEFKEYDEDIADDVEFVTCPECGHHFPK